MSLLVNPFLVRSPLEVLQPAGPGEPPYQLLDLSDDQTHALSEEEFEALKALQARGGRLAAAESATQRALAERGLLLEADTAFRRHNYSYVEAEINRHCNFRCSFCPVKVAPKPTAFMTQEVFQLVLERMVEYGVLQLSLHNYSEPTLDPKLLDKLALAKQAGVRVTLYSNASGLSEKRIDAMAALDVIEDVVVNLPTVDPEHYAEVTGSSVRIFHKVVANLKHMHAAGLKVSLSINARPDRVDADLVAINTMFGEIFGEQQAWRTNARAGKLAEADYAPPLQHEGPLDGCSLAFTKLQVTWDGRVALCCQDYDQDFILGDLRESSIQEIASGDRAAEIRRWLYGPEAPPETAICARCSHTRPRGEAPRWLNAVNLEGVDPDDHPDPTVRKRLRQLLQAPT